MYRSVVLSILFLLVRSVPLLAQETHELQGRVLNSSDNPIAEVQILDQATGLLLTETGKGGEFQLSFPDSVERVSLVFLAEGYQSKVMLLRPSSQLYRIILFEVQRSIEEVTVSRRRLLPISGYAPLTSRFTTLDILMTPRALGDILGGLMEDPDAQSSDTDGRLSLQGGAPHESQVYIDGLRLPNPYSISSKNSSVRSLLSPSECKEINLLSGGYSASMGQALSGVIQILSRDTKDVKPGSLMSLSNIGPSFTWALGAPSSSTKVELSAGYTDLSLYDRVMPSAYHYTRSFYSPSLTASLWHDLPQAMLKAQGPAEKKTPPTHPLTLTVDGIIEPKGELLIAIYSSAESYPQSPYKTAMAKVDSLTKTVLIDLPEGSYGISLFQDVNGNKTLDFNGYIPSEKYGFSNNAPADYGLPSFKDILFTFKAGDIQYITLR